MVSSELKMRIAQNCPGYRNVYPSFTSNILSNESCDSCSNYIRGKCIKDLFDEIKKNISIN